jgi:uncharacterized protein
VSGPAVVARPASDDDVVRFWTELGTPGLIDTHVHFMPESVLRKVWAYFDAAGPLTGREWPIEYRLPESERLDHLRAMGVRAFPSLVYAHKPGMSEWLNDWAAGFAAANEDVIATATMFPEPGVAAYVEKALRSGARIFKVHVQVGGFDPRDPLLDEGWGMLADAGVPVVVHAGSGPTAGSFTGPGPIGEVLERHPSLAMIGAHMGMPEYGDFLGFAEKYDNVMVDTTLCFTDFSGSAFLAPQLAPRLGALQHKVLLGTDFPNIPHVYAHQIEALHRVDLGDKWMRAVCWDNAAALFGIPG